MTLARRTIIASLALALPAAALMVFVADQVRTRDMSASLERVVRGSLTEANREACESDPQWYLAGPRDSRPTPAERSLPDADVNLKRPSRDELPFEFFPYDEQFSGTSTASPRFPEDFKRAMRTSPPLESMLGPYESKSGTGLQMGQLTGWTPGPCAVLLFRLRPSPNAVWMHLLLFGSAFVTSALIVFAATWPITARVTRLAKAARDSARADYSQIATVSGSDDITSLGAAFNEAAADIRKRIVDAQDREETLRRYVEVTKEDVAAPLSELEQRLGELQSHTGVPAADADEVRHAVRDVHQLRARLQNLSSVARLRAVTDQSPRETIDLASLVAHVVADRTVLARAAGVGVDLMPPDAGVTATADGLLLEQAIGNVLDNAILHSGPGARVRVELRGFEHGGRFSLRIADNGRSVPDDAFAELTANRRFRGDESRTRRPGGRGLGLALAREVADRFGLQLDLRRPNAGGFEAELRPRDK